MDLLVLLILWAVAVNVMAFRLRRYLRNPDEKGFFGLFPRQIHVTDFFRPARFGEDGQPLRRTAAIFVVAGVILLILFG